MSKKSRKASKPAPNGTVYLTKEGTRVYITKIKQHPTVQPGDPVWMKAIREKMNETMVAVRISDGHELWGVRPEECTPEKP